MRRWGLLYVLAAGWLTFVAPCVREPDGTCPRSWLAVRVLLATSIAIQYAAALSAPPTVWAEPDRRPWAHIGHGWPEANGTCARLGVTPVDAASGLVCWMAVDGTKNTSTLLWEMTALGTLTLCCLCPRPKGELPGACRPPPCSHASRLNLAATCTDPSPCRSPTRLDSTPAHPT